MCHGCSFPRSCLSLGLVLCMHVARPHNPDTETVHTTPADLTMGNAHHTFLCVTSYIPCGVLLALHFCVICLQLTYFCMRACSTQHIFTYAHDYNCCRETAEATRRRRDTEEGPGSHRHATQRGGAPLAACGRLWRPPCSTWQWSRAALMCTSAGRPPTPLTAVIVA